MTGKLCIASPRDRSEYDAAMNRASGHRRQSLAGFAALAKAQCCLLPVGTGELGGQLATVFAGHHAFQMLDDGRNRRNVFAERFGAMDDTDPCLPAQELIVRGLVGVLKSSPPADIQDQDGVERMVDGQRIAEKLLERVPAFQGQTALSGIDVGRDNVVAVRLRILGDGVLLILGGIALVVRGHAQILRRPYGTIHAGPVARHGLPPSSTRCRYPTSKFRVSIDGRDFGAVDPARA